MKAGWFKSGHHRGGMTVELPAVLCLSYCRRDEPEGFEPPVAAPAAHRRLNAGFCAWIMKALYKQPFQIRRLGTTSCTSVGLRALESFVDGLQHAVGLGCNGFDGGPQRGVLAS